MLNPIVSNVNEYGDMKRKKRSSAYLYPFLDPSLNSRGYSVRESLRSARAETLNSWQFAGRLGDCMHVGGKDSMLKSRLISKLMLISVLNGVSVLHNPKPQKQRKSIKLSQAKRKVLFFSLLVFVGQKKNNQSH